MSSCSWRFPARVVAVTNLILTATFILVHLVLFLVSNEGEASIPFTVPAFKLFYAFVPDIPTWGHFLLLLVRLADTVAAAFLLRSSAIGYDTKLISKFAWTWVIANQVYCLIVVGLIVWKSAMLPIELLVRIISIAIVSYFIKELNTMTTISSSRTEMIGRNYAL